MISRVLAVLTRRTRTSPDDEATAAIRRPVLLTVLFIGVNEAQEAANWYDGDIWISRRRARRVGEHLVCSRRGTRACVR